MDSSQIIIAGQVALGVYALLLIGGGYMGYAKAGSRPSLIAGSISGVIGLVALALTWMGGLGFWLGLILAAVMTLMFAMRFLKSRKFMPSGLLAVLSVLMLPIMGLAISRLG